MAFCNCTNPMGRTAVIVAFATTLLLLTQSPLFALSAESAAYKRFNDNFDRGNYAQALVEAEKLEAAVRSRLGTKHPAYGAVLTYVGMSYDKLGKYDKAEEVYRRILPIYEKALGASHAGVGEVLNNLGTICEAQGKYSEAEQFYRRALPIYEKTLGPGNTDYANTLNNLARINEKTDKLADAIDLYQRAIEIKDKVLGANHRETVPMLINLASVYLQTGKYKDAEELQKQAVTINERSLGANHPDVAEGLQNLAATLEIQGRFTEAEGLDRRALAIREKSLGQNHPAVAFSLNSLAVVCTRLGNLTEAEALYKRSLAIQQATLGTSHPATADALNNLGLLYLEQGKYSDARENVGRASTIVEQTFGPRSLKAASSLNNLALIYQVEGKYSQADPLYRRSLAIEEAAFGPSHPSVAKSFNVLSLLETARGNVDDALSWSRKAKDAVLAHATVELRTAGPQHQAGLIEQRTFYFQNHVMSLSAASHLRADQRQSFGLEAFESAQWSLHSSAAAAIQQMSVRFSSGNGALAELVRESQDLSDTWQSKDKMLTAERSKPEAEQNPTAIEQLRKYIAQIEQKLAANKLRMEKEFPAYATLVRPKPLQVDEVPKLIGADEALVLFLTGDKESYVFAVTREGFDWKTIALNENQLSARVAAFRRGLDVSAPDNPGASKENLFNLDLAFELYTTLLGPVEATVKGKSALLIVPSGVLTALPFHLLVTEKPPVSVPGALDRYRDVSWLAKRQSTDILPSVASLRTLRLFAGKGLATKPMIGFGDPVFNAPDAGSADKRAARRAVQTRSYSEFWQGAGIDRDKLAQALPALPDTADELKAVAASLGAPASDIHLGADASETTVKRAPLIDYRVVYFATHALVAGDVKGVGEPALVLSLPTRPSDQDDGLLTPGEIAQLKLNADWVVLSACNTIAGDKPGAEALSGLARAFFYAGARALLVSHWAVESDAATRLTTSTFDILKSDPKLGRAEALRRAMVNYLNDRSSPRNAYPAYWAPFVVIGEGANQ